DRIDQSTGGHLARHRAHGAYRERHPDGGLRPLLAAEIHRDEGAEAGLYVGDEQIEIVESAARRSLGGTRRRRCRAAAPARRLISLFGRRLEHRALPAARALAACLGCIPAPTA